MGGAKDLIIYFPSPSFTLITNQVAEERGHSPRQTRSATKKKKNSSDASATRGGGVALFFSPPDQNANERREKARIAEMEAER